MIQTTHRFIDQFFQEHPNLPGGTVLDVGSLDVNGNSREDFTGKGYKYLGIDMRGGENVDQVMNAHDIKKHFGKESFDIVVCFDTLEHDDKFWITIENLRWVLKKGGWLLLGAPSLSHPRHMHPSDYYRFLGTAFYVFLKGFKDVFVVEEFYNGNSEDMPDQVFAWGRKP